MAKPLDALFEVTKPERYPSDRAALDAVCDGTKAVHWTSVAIDGDEANALARLALARGLALVLRPTGERGIADAYAVQLHDAWRVTALETLRSTTTDWTFDHEAQQSALLGYTQEQTELYLARHRHDLPAYGGRTIYALVTAAQRAAIVALGNRCFGTEQLAFFRHATNMTIKRGAFAKLPKGTTLARATVTHATTRDALGKTGVPSSIDHVNAGLRSNVQFLTASGWR